MNGDDTEENPDCEAKVAAIFRELVGDRANQLAVPVPTAQAMAREALLERFGQERASDIAFHLTDWASDAAFIVALTLFPERFSSEEIRDAIEGFVIHAPNHVAAAAKLHGHPVADIFGVGGLVDTTIATLDLIEIKASGARHPIHVEVGQPRRDPNGAWRCSILAAGIDREARDIFGEDSLQALCLGLQFLRARLDFVIQRGSRLVDIDEDVDFPIDAYFRTDGTHFHR